MSSTLLIVLIVVLWLVVLAPLLLRHQRPVQRTTKALEETRVLFAGGQAAPSAPRSRRVQLRAAAAKKARQDAMAAAETDDEYFLLDENPEELALATISAGSAAREHAESAGTRHNGGHILSAAGETMAESNETTAHPASTVDQETVVMIRPGESAEAFGGDDNDTVILARPADLVDATLEPAAEFELSETVIEAVVESYTDDADQATSDAARAGENVIPFRSGTSTVTAAVDAADGLDSADAADAAAPSAADGAVAGDAADAAPTDGSAAGGAMDTAAQTSTAAKQGDADLARGAAAATPTGTTASATSADATVFIDDAQATEAGATDATNTTADLEEDEVDDAVVMDRQAHPDAYTRPEDFAEFAEYDPAFDVQEATGTDGAPADVHEHFQDPFAAVRRPKTSAQLFDDGMDALSDEELAELAQADAAAARLQAASAEDAEEARTGAETAGRGAAPLPPVDLDAPLTAAEQDYVATRQGRGIYDPVIARRNAQRRFERRKRMLIVLFGTCAVLTIAAVIQGGMWWLGTVGALVATVLYLSFLRKQTVEERRLEARRLRRLRRARMGVRNIEDDELGVPARLRQPAGTVVETLDGDPDLIELDYVDASDYFGAPSNGGEFDADGGVRRRA